MERKASSIRYSERTASQLEWLAKRENCTKTEVIAIAIDRMAREYGFAPSDSPKEDPKCA